MGALSRGYGIFAIQQTSSVESVLQIEINTDEDYVIIITLYVSCAMQGTVVYR